MDNGRLVSVVLPVYNQACTVKRCLETLVGQTYTPKEIIVVDDGSTDQTLSILREFAKNEQIKILRIVHSGRSAARNRGAGKAQGSILAFVEADAEYDPIYLSAGLECFTDPRIGAVYVQHQAYHRKGWITEAVWLEREILFRGYKPFSAWFYKKDVFTSLGGFDENLECAEDQDLARRFRNEEGTIGFEPRILWWHREPHSLTEVIKRSFWRGYHKIPFYEKYPREVPTKKLVLTTIGLILPILALKQTSFIIVLFSLLLLLFLGKTYSISCQGWKIARKRRYLILVSALSIVRNTFSSLGTLIGFLEYLLRHPLIDIATQ